MSRGSLSPISAESLYLNHEDTCKLVVNEFGWPTADCPFLENLIVWPSNGVDTMIVRKPNSDGYVEFDEWDSADRDEAIEDIWDGIVVSSKGQSKVLGYDVHPVEWALYPTLDKDTSILYYAILFEWAGENVLNIKASLFDRKGYIPFDIIPENTSLSAVQIESLVKSNLSAYQADENQSYVSFESGDKVAAIGALGVLASMVGVKYGKGIWAAAVAIFLAFAKKLWFLILLPLYFLKRMFSKTKKEDDRT